MVRAGWQWAAVEGTAELIGPDDPHADVDAERLRLLLREIFTAAGGTHDDWETYDTRHARRATNRRARHSDPRLFESELTIPTRQSRTDDLGRLWHDPRAWSKATSAFAT